MSSINTGINQPTAMISVAAAIKVIGVGAGGCNNITRMVRAGISGLEYIAMDTDADYLEITETNIRIPLGERVTAGLGAGGDQYIGRKAAEETRTKIQQVVAGAEMVFLVAGFGGGTGSGALPVVAEIAKQSGAVTIGVIAKPFSFEGPRRGKIAEEGVKQLSNLVNTLIVVENNDLIYWGHQGVDRAFENIDEYLCRGIRSIVTSWLGDKVSIRLKNLFREMGLSKMVVETSSGENWTEKVTTKILESNQFSDCSLRDVKKAALLISSKTRLPGLEVEDVARIIKQGINPNVDVILRASVDPKCDDEIYVTLICEFIKKPPIPEYYKNTPRRKYEERDAWLKRLHR